MVLSQPTMHTSPSSRWPRTTSSIESAITSRETSEARMPSVPIETPSETAIVLNSTGVPPASRIPRRTWRASSRWFQLHGIVSIQVVAMPTSGRASASSSRPIALSIARAGARSTPSVMAALLRLAGSVGRLYGSLNAACSFACDRQVKNVVLREALGQRDGDIALPVLARPDDHGRARPGEGRAERALRQVGADLAQMRRVLGAVRLVQTVVCCGGEEGVVA